MPSFVFRSFHYTIQFVSSFLDFFGKLFFNTNVYFSEHVLLFRTSSRSWWYRKRATIDRAPFCNFPLNVWTFPSSTCLSILRSLYKKLLSLSSQFSLRWCPNPVKIKLFSMDLHLKSVMSFLRSSSYFLFSVDLTTFSKNNVSTFSFSFFVFQTFFLYRFYCFGLHLHTFFFLFQCRREMAFTSTWILSNFESLFLIFCTLLSTYFVD